MFSLGSGILHYHGKWEWQVPDGRVACFDYTQLRERAASAAPCPAHQTPKWFNINKGTLQPHREACY